MALHSSEHQAAIARYEATGDPRELVELGLIQPPAINKYAQPDPLAQSVDLLGNQVGIADTPGLSQPPALAPAPQTNVEGLDAFYTAPQPVGQPQPQAPTQAQAPVDTSMPVKHTKPEGFETPRRPEPTDASTPMWKNPQFWDAAATAAGPVLGALLAPRPAPNVPTLSSPVAGSGSPSQMQSVLGGPLPIDPRIMRPFG